jgi:hypothetical protein
MDPKGVKPLAGDQAAKPAYGLTPSANPAVFGVHKSIALQASVAQSGLTRGAIAAARLRGTVSNARHGLLD